ncbi:MAG TPA: hypothetical protein VLE53_04560 [Gemmatimonadaceae bacterium]|nr:hypothetical protein [Gemmatimonadaceae bacterium]
MSEERFNEMMHDAARTYRVPPEPDFEAMWLQVEREVFAEREARVLRFRSPSWQLFAAGIAAALVIGVGLGRLTSGATGDAPAAAVAVAPRTDSVTSMTRNGYDRAATELLGKTAVLLTTLPTEAQTVQGNIRFSTQALELLTTTRLLLDSPAATDGRFRELLEDLELVLAQVASLRPARAQGEIELITDALEERDMVPRIRSAVARLSSGDD